MITRTLAIIPTIIVVAVTGEQGTEKLLILSQVILVAAIELCGGAAGAVYRQPQVDGRVCECALAARAGVATAALIAGLNVWLLVETAMGR